MNALRDLTVRLMFQRDLPAVLEIEQRPGSRPWTRNDFLPVFDDPHTDGWVAELDGQVIGYLVFQTTPQGRTLLNLAVAPYWRRRGIARTMLQLLHERDPARVEAAVPEANLPAQLLLRDAGYQAVRIVPGQFGDEDSYLMVRLPGLAASRSETSAGSRPTCRR